MTWAFGANLVFVGEFLGGQNAALNLAPFAVPEAGSAAILGIGLAIMAGCRGRRRGIAAV